MAALSASLLQAQPLPSEQERARRIQRLEQITTANPRDVGAWHDLAGLYRQAADWDAAIRAETEAITRHARYAAAYYGRGKARLPRRTIRLRVVAEIKVPPRVTGPASGR